MKSSAPPPLRCCGDPVPPRCCCWGDPTPSPQPALAAAYLAPANNAGVARSDSDAARGDPDALLSPSERWSAPAEVTSPSPLDVVGLEFPPPPEAKVNGEEAEESRCDAADNNNSAPPLSLQSSITESRRL